MEEKKMTIEFCLDWNYAPKAVSLAEEIFNHYRKNVGDVTLIPSGRGIFDVKLGNELLFSKYDVDRFPEENEVSGIIDEKQLLDRVDG